MPPGLLGLWNLSPFLAWQKLLNVCRKKTAKKFKLKICFEQYRSRKSIPRFPEPEAGVDTAEGGLALTG